MLQSNVDVLSPNRNILLNPEQQMAVDHREGPCLVLAGPGSGKTRVIVERFLALTNQGLAPEEILVLTYTVKAAREMRQRVENFRESFDDDSPLTNFHSFSRRVLREWGWLIGIHSNFRTPDNAERWILLKEILAEMRPRTLWSPTRPTATISELLRLIESSKQNLISPDRYIEWAKAQLEQELTPDEHVLAERHLECAQVYANLQQIYAERGLVDHDDVIYQATHLLRNFPEVQHGVAKKLHYIMVDEYQDTNYAQAGLIKSLLTEHQNIFVVADDDQAIYKFRGASQTNIANFSLDYPQHKTIFLNRNYRSIPAIVEAANILMGSVQTPYRSSKKLASEHPTQASKRINLWQAAGQHAEATAFAQKIRELIESGVPPKEIAWLFRQYAHMEDATAALRRHEIPYVVTNGRGFFILPEIKDLLALFKTIINPDDSTALLRCFILPAWKLSGMTRLALPKLASEQGKSIWELVQEKDRLAQLEQKDQAKIQTCVEILSELHLRADLADVRELFYDAVNFSRFAIDYQFPYPTARAQFLANLNKFGELLESFVDRYNDCRITKALEYLEASSDSTEADQIPAVDEENDGITLMTTHGAKGLEWQVVFMNGCTKQRWPGRGGPDGSLKLPDDLVADKPLDDETRFDEERRLFYVALTRAKNDLHLSYSNKSEYNSFDDEDGSISPFLVGIRANQDICQTVTLKNDFQLAEAPTVRNGQIDSTHKEFRLPPLSVSALTTFKDCPRRFAYKSVYKIPILESVAQWYGSRIHEVLQQAAQIRLAKGEIENEEVLRIWETTWQQSRKPPSVDQHVYIGGQEQLTNYLASAAWTEAHILTVENPFILTVANQTIRGRFDRIDQTSDGTSTVVDYKTGSYKDSKAAESDQQVRAYALAQSKLTGQEEVSVQLHYLSTAQVTTAKFTPAKLRNTEQTLTKTVTEAAVAWVTHDFPAKPSSFKCRRCDYRAICDKSAAV